MEIFVRILLIATLGIILSILSNMDIGRIVIALLVSYLFINNFRLKKTISKLQNSISLLRIQKENPLNTNSDNTESPEKHSYKYNPYNSQQEPSQHKPTQQANTKSAIPEPVHKAVQEDNLPATDENFLLNVSDYINNEASDGNSTTINQDQNINSTTASSNRDFKFEYTQKNEGSAEPKESLFDQACSFVVKKVKGYFTSGNTIVRVGIVVLFFGVAFLLKYVAQHTQLPIELRYIATALGGFALLFFGWRVRTKNIGYSLSLQGGGIGILYLTVFAALRISHILSPTATFALLVVIVILSCTIALLQNAPALAVLSILGGFFAPIIASTGSGNFVHLFAYYLILNIGIAFTAWFKSWRALNLIGFIFTFVIGLLWGLKYYQPEHYDSIQPFLIAYFLLYSFISIVFTIKQADKGIKYIDSALVFGTPIAAYGLQAAIVHEINMGVGISAAIIGGYYILITYLLLKLYGSKAKILLESFLAFGIGFLTLAIPLASTDGRITSASWAVEGAALLWIGIRQDRTLARITGTALILLGSISFAIGLKVDPTPLSAAITPFLNSDFIGVVLITASSIFAGLFLLRNGGKISNFEKQNLCSFMVVYGYIWWMIGGIMQIDYFADHNQIIAIASFLAFTAFTTCFYGYKKQMLLFYGLGLITLIFGLPLIMEANALLHKRDLLFLNREFITVAIFAATTIAIALYGHFTKLGEQIKINSTFLLVILLYGIGTILFTTLNDLNNKLLFGEWTVAATLFCCVFFFTWGYVSKRIKWSVLKNFYLLVIPAALVFMVLNISHGINLHKNIGIIIFPLAIVIGYYLLYCYDNKPQFTSKWIHFGSLIALTAITCWQFENILQWTFNMQANLVIHSIWGFIPTLVLAVIILNRNYSKWPIRNHSQIYTLYIPAAAIASMLLWLLVINLSKPTLPSFGSYLPVLNAYDITQAFIILAIWASQKTLFSKLQRINKEHAYAAIFVTAFAVLNFTLFRTLYFRFGLEYAPDTIIESALAQTCISILWGVCGMGIMILSAKKMWRPVWISGAAIIAVLVIKLFIFDTSGIGTIERIVAFISVGIVLLITGYFAPVPPSRSNHEEQPAQQSIPAGE